ncbi:hypothetical protein MFIFM68171_07169 [Madurella fahalii]|uniref:DUF7371 domain-containing protein n=1 Tax=Madurella fahalii TaxID=1157608 RepID=A0ABQ0GGR9_9PEZI
MSNTTSAVESGPTLATLPPVSVEAPSGSTVSSVSAAAAPGPTRGVERDRELVIFEFDDIPTLSGHSENDTSGTQSRPVPSPYHHFVFSKGFRLVSPPTTKYQPASGSWMLKHSPSSSVAQIGLGQLRENQCFRFSFRSISLGCNSLDAPCVFRISGLRWNGIRDVVQGTATFKIAACRESSHCVLSRRVLDSVDALPLTNLTAVNITLVTAGEPQTWWADDLHLAWTDNSCSASTCRAMVPSTNAVTQSRPSFTGRAKGLPRRAVRG